MLYGGVGMILFVLVVVEAVSYWHTHNVLEAAAAEGVRVAAAFDGTCAQGTTVARDSITRRAGSWADKVTITCTVTAGEVTMTIAGESPGVVLSRAGVLSRVAESAPKER